MGKSMLKERNGVSDSHPMPKSLDPVREVSPTEVDEALSHVRFEHVAGRWTAQSADFRHFSAQGRTEDECRSNARINMKWYLERKPRRS
ncbi:MAG: hypothetical protein AB7G11_15225 [Phycisphaerales bacterium]